MRRPWDHAWAWLRRHRTPTPPPAAAPLPRPSANDAFTPTRPKPGRRQVVGRAAERARIVQAIVEERAHVVLYSERGRGKTSLANLAIEALRREGRIVARHTCEASSTFESILRGLARELPASLLRMAQDSGEGCEPALPTGALQPADILKLHATLQAPPLVWVVDEFDRVEDTPTRTLFADTIKQLSDRDIPIAFLIVGVSENLEQIIGQHPSIQRSIVAVHLPLASDADIATMLLRGGEAMALEFADETIATVQAIARGMPYMAQLLGLRIAQAARARAARATGLEDVQAARARVLQDMPQEVAAQHARLTRHGANTVMVSTLRKLTAAPQDAWGRLNYAEMSGDPRVGGARIDRACWDALRAEGLARAVPGRGTDHALIDRALMNYVLLQSARLAEPAFPPNAEPSAPRGLKLSVAE